MVTLYISFLIESLAIANHMSAHMFGYITEVSMTQTSVTVTKPHVTFCTVT